MSELPDPHPSPGEAPISTHEPSPPEEIAGGDDSPDQSSDELNREVAEAMAAMDPADVAELSGQFPTSDSIEPGSELTGTIVGVSDEDLFIEFGAKAQGVMPRSQFGKKEPVEVGRRVDVVVDRYDEESGLLLLYRKGAIQRATWLNLSVGMLVEGRVTGLVKGGLELDINGIRAFMPGSQVDSGPVKDISVFLNEKMRCEVVEADRRGKNLLVSRRKLVQAEQAESRAKLREELAVGQVRSGTVKTITDFGAFVDLGGLEGLLHISDLSWGTVAKVTDVVSVGQAVEVQVLKIEKERNRISLGLKQAQPDPWTTVPDRYPVGTEVKVRVIRTADFGAFAELEPGIEGLIPISELGWSRVQKTTDVAKVGDVLNVVVIRLEMQKHRLALSLKQAQPDPWSGVLESFTEKSIVKGRVTRLADFGAFVELVPGVEGLVHISELSDQRVKTCGDVVREGQEIEVRVLGIDAETRRIALSIKQVAAPTEAAAPDPTEAPKPPKKRKTKLRGGLSSHYDW